MAVDLWVGADQDNSVEGSKQESTHNVGKDHAKVAARPRLDTPKEPDAGPHEVTETDLQGVRKKRKGKGKERHVQMQPDDSDGRGVAPTTLIRPLLIPASKLANVLSI